MENSTTSKVTAEVTIQFHFSWWMHHYSSIHSSYSRIKIQSNLF